MQTKSEIFVLVSSIVQGNPGAMTIVQHVMTLPIWPQLLYHLRAQGLVGSALWCAVKDEYGHDWRRFVANQMAQMGQFQARWN